MKPKRSLLSDSLHLVALFNLALAQPLYELLSRHAEFFVARRSQPIDLVLLAFTLSFALPGLAVLAQLTLCPRRPRRFTQAGLMGGFMGVLALLVLKQASGLAGGIMAGGAALAGAIFAFAYLRFSAARLLVTTLTPAIVICPALFLGHSQVLKLLRPATAIDVRNQGGVDTPVVLVVFDELPLISLMDEERGIDAERYPQFAALAREAIWFRNATTVSPATPRAVPAILTGTYCDWSQLPTFVDHPHNLFTLLASSHELHVSETVTRLCPPELQAGEERAGLGQRLRDLASDLAVVAGHVFLPADWTTGLPSITRSWAGFAGSCCEPGVNWERRPRQVEEFILAIQPAHRPGLHFLHVLLPHSPFSFLPSGKFYGQDQGIDGLRPDNVWTVEEEPVLQTQQRHLLQVGYVDSLLGKLIARLKEKNLYDRSLLMVTADHGIAFRPGEPYRELTSTNYADILRVPLFLKLPGQTQGRVSDRNAQTIDILPTIADVLGARLAAHVDGRSLINESAPEPPHKTVVARDRRWTFDAGPDEGWDGLDHRLARLGAGSWKRLYRREGEGMLLACSLSECRMGKPLDVELVVDRAGLQDHDPSRAYTPCRIEGIVCYSDHARPLDVAVAVHGVIQARVRTHAHQKDAARLTALLPEASLRRGSNLVQFFAIAGESEGRPILCPLQDRQAGVSSYRLTQQNGREGLVSNEGRIIRLKTGTVSGRLDRVHIEGDSVEFLGWATDVNGRRPAREIILLAEGRCLHAAAPNQDRPDVAAHYANAELHWSGFRFSFPLARLHEFGQPRSREGPAVRVFAVSRDGVASELAYPSAYRRLSLRPLARGVGTVSD